MSRRHRKGHEAAVPRARTNRDDVATEAGDVSQTPATRHAPDVRQLRDRELPQVPFPVGSEQDLRVYFTPEAYEAVNAHALEDTTVEICGVLVGTWARDAGGAFLQITDAIRGEAAKNKFAEVTFTHDTWARINEEMDRRFADRAIVGWYHTHPDFGVFLSDRDRFIQEHFFCGAGQIAMVIDPVRRTVGAFAWREGKPTLCPHIWVGDRVVVGTAAGEEIALATATERAAPVRPIVARPAESPPSPWTTQALAYLAVFLLGNLIASYRSSWEQTRLAEGAVAHFGVWRALRPGLHERLGALGGQLETLTRRIDGLSTDHLKRLDGRKDAQDLVRQWNQVRRSLADTAQRVGELDRRYSLTPEESTALERLVLQSLRSVSDPGEAVTPDRPAVSAPLKSTGGVLPAPAPAGAGGDRATPVAKPAARRPPEPSK